MGPRAEKQKNITFFKLIGKLCIILVNILVNDTNLHHGFRKLNWSPSNWQLIGPTNCLTGVHQLFN